jgi:anaerobic nitric oxide reductase transcription regulator
MTFEAVLLDVALDLTRSLSRRERYERLVAAARRAFPCDAAAILRLERGALVPVAVFGLPATILGRPFRPADQPRLGAIVASRSPVRFAGNDARPDPYDGLLELASGHGHVHGCMGCALYVDDELVGAMTLDSAKAGAFDAIDDETVAMFGALVAAAMRAATMMDALEAAAERRDLVARQLVRDAMSRDGNAMIGDSAAMQGLHREIALVAGSDLSVLITGETGTGKELVARTIHLRSPRAEQPLVQVNCAALPESIAESELFGHVKGAFSGASADRAGKFELAHEGTLFLDEVGELSLAIQAKLLRALQQGEIQRVGADKNLHVDVRIVAATNRILADEVKAGRFRADLYHRLGVYPIQVPTLRDRVEDLPMLAAFFLDRARARLGVGPIRLSSGALAALARYSWPGNVRELEHVLLRVALRSKGPREKGVLRITEADLALPDQSPAGSPAVPARPAADPAPSRSLAEATRAFQRSTVRSAVAAENGNWAKAAKRLGMDAGNLHRLARRLEIKTQ